MTKIYMRAKARLDLVERYAYLSEHASESVADRFLVNAEASFALLAQQPLIGSPLVLRRPELSGMRMWRVAEFEDTLIFYMPLKNGISVVRVLHATQDWWNLLALGK